MNPSARTIRPGPRRGCPTGSLAGRAETVVVRVPGRDGLGRLLPTAEHLLVALVKAQGLAPCGTDAFSLVPFTGRDVLAALYRVWEQLSTQLQPYPASAGRLDGFHRLTHQPPLVRVEAEDLDLLTAASVAVARLPRRWAEFLERAHRRPVELDALGRLMALLRTTGSGHHVSRSESRRISWSRI